MYYRSVEHSEVPLYWEAREKLEDLDSDRSVVFGRDGRYFFTALKASDFGIGEKELKYAIVTRPMTDAYREYEDDKDDADARALVAKYLKQNGVTLDFSFIDTGFTGSIPEFSIKCLAESEGVELSSKEIDEKIKLLSSTREKRGELSKKRLNYFSRSSLVDTIEDRPKNIESPNYLVMDDSGRIKPQIVPKEVKEQIYAWVVEHAVLRNFVPRFDPEKKIKYIQQNPLDGYSFIETFSGNSIGTHPMELWENKLNEKFLIKGGPTHTVRADFVGQQFLDLSGVKTPQTEIIDTEEGPKLKMEFLEGWKGGGINLPEAYHNNYDIQKGFFVDILLGQYDRTSWNLMFNEGSVFKAQVAFIDNGGSLTSRARGGHKGFPDYFDTEQLKKLLSNPQFEGKPVNEAYTNLVEVKDGKVLFKNKGLLANFLISFQEKITDGQIDDIIEEAGFRDGRRSIRILEERIHALEQELSYLFPDSSDYKKTEEAIDTYRKMIESGGEATYLKAAIKKRKEDIVKLFGEVFT